MNSVIIAAPLILQLETQHPCYAYPVCVQIGQILTTDRRVHCWCFLLAELDLGAMQTNRDWPWNEHVSNLVCFVSDRKRKTGRKRGREDGKHVSPPSLHVWVRLREVLSCNGAGKVIQSCF